MNTLKKTFSSNVWFVVVGLVVSVACRSLAAAEESSTVDHAAALEPFVDDDTFLVGYVDLGALSAESGQSEIEESLTLMTGDESAAKAFLQTATGAIQELQAAGVEGLHVVLGLTDIFPASGPLGVVHLNADANPKTVEDMLRGLTQPATADGALSQVQIRQHSPRLVLVGTKLTLDRYEALAASQRDDLLKPLAILTGEGAELAAVFSPGSDFRRVVRELWPELPPPLTLLQGELADRWLRLELAARTQPNATAKLAMQATNHQAAELFVELLRSLPEASEQIPELDSERQRSIRKTLQTIVDALPTRVDDARAVITLPTDEMRIAQLRRLVSEAGDTAMQSARRHERMNQFKQLALAMHIYADKHKHFPSAAIRDENGRPLLSWRVAVLPYVDEKALYDEFHLDEPWDSPHNRALIARMPNVFADPSSKVSRAAGAGKTTFVVPTGAGTVFDRAEGTEFKEITDGTSRTIMIVEVPPERAVEWTRPEDWEVELKQPLQGLARTDRDYFIAAFCDGHVRVFPDSTDPEVLRAVLTRSGEEVVD